MIGEKGVAPKEQIEPWLFYGYKADAPTEQVYAEK